MNFTVITPNYNGGRFLEETIRSVAAQKRDGVRLEYIVVDGLSTDGSLDIVEKHARDVDRLIVEADTGPANAINKGLAAASGDVVAWLNADDVYHAGALHRVRRALDRDPGASFAFGRCPIVDRRGREIRHAITAFKESFFPFSGRFTFQCINYLSQPAVFFRRNALRNAGLLREDMVAAWDYEFFLRLWREGGAVRVPGGPLASFRWQETSISGRLFHVQFREELESAIADAGRRSAQALIHRGVRRGIVGAYTLMGRMR